MCGILTTLALIFSYVETLVPLNVSIPGIKLGLANLVIVFALIKLDVASATTIAALRVILVGFLFGGLSGIIYSLAGMVCSLLVMVTALAYSRFHLITVSIFGALAHIIGQLIVAACIVGAGPIIGYAPFCMLAALISGAVIGIVDSEILKRVFV
ncbi:MAG: Gx transporter family protein [Lachnospiraceae bacterium]|nr:Gx transporter family protein [Candidatus Colinaster equi]